MCSAAQVSCSPPPQPESFRGSRLITSPERTTNATASILHLLAIALDRYWAVTRVDYIRCQRNERRIFSMILLVWLAASIISLAPVFGWKDSQFELRITNDQECLISQDIGYQIFATCTTFYFPLTLTLIFYWKIYQVSSAQRDLRSLPTGYTYVLFLRVVGRFPTSSGKKPSVGSLYRVVSLLQITSCSDKLRCDWQTS